MPVNTTERLAELRALMKSEKYDVDAFLIPSEDAHKSEYIADCDKRRHWISGFTGSAGFAVVTATEAALFTDGRYFLQASKQIDDNWTLMKVGLPGVPKWEEYLSKNMPKGSRIGYDPSLLPLYEADSVQEGLQSVDSTLVPLQDNLVDLVWGKDRPDRPTHKVMVHNVKYAGQPYQEKLEKLREHIKSKNAYGFFVAALDEIAWLFNLRGSDIDCNPVFFSYALVTEDSATLFIDTCKLSEESENHLKGVSIQPYDAVFDYLKTLSKTLASSNKKLLMDYMVSVAVRESAGTDNVFIDEAYITNAKAIKNDAELQGMRDCHLRDGAALVQYLAWLEKKLLAGERLDEVDGADRLAKFRAMQNDFVGLSFETISSTGPNGAIIHYKPEKDTCAVIDPHLIYLCDSGGQYRDGTTDVTRTFHFGDPDAYQKRCFTRVLQGHIAIDTCVFPSGTSGLRIDAFARMFLWKDGLDFRHGTGHGVGSFLNVHEGPHGIGIREEYNKARLLSGMTVTNEPGYYEDGKFGIRIENVMLITKAKTPNNFGDQGYLGFEHVTMAPLCRKLIDVDLLSSQEREWVNSYHAECYEKLLPLVSGDQEAVSWLKKETLSI